MGFRRELSNSLNEIITCSKGDQQAVTLRLKVLNETALINGDVPLDAIDLIDQAQKKKKLIPNQNFQQPLQYFSTSEQQLLFFLEV